MTSGSAALDRDMDVHVLIDMPSNAGSTFNQDPATSVFSLQGGSDAIPVWGVASGEIFRVFAVEQNLVAGHQN
jgi:hypothetical protein